MSSNVDIPFSSFVKGQFIGYFGNNIFPFRFGELIRSYYLSKQEQIEIPEIIGSIVVERFLDFVIIIIFIIILVSTGFLFPDSIMPVIWIFVGVAFFLGVFIYFFPHIKGINFKNEKFEKIRATFIEGLHSMKDLRKLPILILLTCIIWFFYGLTVMFVLFAFGAKWSFILILLILSFAAIGINIPSAPGAIGTHHMAVIIALKEVAGFDLSFAQGLSILYHAINYVPVTVIGLYFFTKFNMNLSEIKLFK